MAGSALADARTSLWADFDSGFASTVAASIENEFGGSTVPWATHARSITVAKSDLADDETALRLARSTAIGSAHGTYHANVDSAFVVLEDTRIADQISARIADQQAENVERYDAVDTENVDVPEFVPYSSQPVRTSVDEVEGERPEFNWMTSRLNAAFDALAGLTGSESVGSSVSVSDFTSRGDHFGLASGLDAIGRIVAQSFTDIVDTSLTELQYLDDGYGIDAEEESTETGQAFFSVPAVLSKPDVQQNNFGVLVVAGQPTISTHATDDRAYVEYSEESLRLYREQIDSPGRVLEENALEDLLWEEVHAMGHYRNWTAEDWAKQWRAWAAIEDVRKVGRSTDTTQTIEFEEHVRQLAGSGECAKRRA